MLAFVVGAEGRGGGARTADRIQLVDEDDARGGGFGFGEEVADARRAHADDGFNKLRRREAEERAVRLTGDGSGEQRLAGPRRADQQDAVWDLGAQPLVLFWCLEEVDNFGQLLLGLVDPRHVGKGGPRSRVGSVELRLTLAEGAENAARARGRHPPAQVEQATDQQQRRPEADQQGQQWRLARAGWRRGDRNIVLLEQRSEVVLGEHGPLGLEESPAR